MKTLAIAIGLCVAMIGGDIAFAQVQGGTGKLGFQLNNFGRVRVNTPVWTGGLRQVDRMTFVGALDSLRVFDYTQDANTVDNATLTTGGVADTIATVLCDNSFTNQPPNIRVRTTVYAWRNDDFIIVKYTVRNMHTTTYPLYFGSFVVPKPSNIYGGETMDYDATKRVAYYYRTGEVPYIGIKVLSGNPFSYHHLQWDVYSPDPNADSANDLTRWRMTSRPGFDAALTANVNGGAMSLNAGLRTIAPGDSASAYYAIIFTNSLATLQTEADSAQIRYNSRFTSVDPISFTVTDAFSLQQNYPNPFNPATRIEFTIKSAAMTTLRVYNMLGQEVATLANEQLAPGTYAADFTATNLPSGVYFYKLTSGTFSETRRMILVR